MSPFYVHALELSEVLSVNIDAVFNLFTSLALNNWDKSTPDAFAVFPK